jgi:phage N-6-adenine-methyltransferase
VQSNLFEATTTASEVVAPKSNSRKKRGLVHEDHSEEVEWYTPHWVFDGLGFEFDLDPASPMSGPVTPAKRHYTKADNGLVQPWAGSVWLNPPYGEVLPLWTRKMKEHNNGIALVFVRTDTAWFHNAPPDAALFLQGRIRFVNGKTGKLGGQPGVPSFLLAYGAKMVQALENSDLKGTMMYAEPRAKRPLEGLF